MVLGDKFSEKDPQKSLTMPNSAPGINIEEQGCYEVLHNGYQVPDTRKVDGQENIFDLKGVWSHLLIGPCKNV